MPLHPATHGIHADNHTNILTDVAPPIHTSTTFRYPRDPSKLHPVSPEDGEVIGILAEEQLQLRALRIKNRNL